MEDELVASIESQPQLVHQYHVGARRQMLLKYFEVAAPRILDGEHGLVGAVQQRPGVSAVRGMNGDADACPLISLLPSLLLHSDAEYWLHRPEHPIGD